jgi:hypothetical protein
MSKLPTQKRLLREELKEAPNWIDKLLSPINQFMENVYSLFNKNIDFTNNIRCDIVEVQFKTSATGSYTLPIVLNHKLRSRPSGVLLLEIRQVDGVYSPVTGATGLQWRAGNEKVFIESIGLATLNNSTTYQLRFLII